MKEIRKPTPQEVAEFGRGPYVKDNLGIPTVLGNFDILVDVSKLRENLAWEIKDSPTKLFQAESALNKLTIFCGKRAIETIMYEEVFRKKYSEEIASCMKVLYTSCKKVGLIPFSLGSTHVSEEKLLLFLNTPLLAETAALKGKLLEELFSKAWRHERVHLTTGLTDEGKKIKEIRNKKRTVIGVGTSAAISTLTYAGALRLISMIKSERKISRRTFLQNTLLFTGSFFVGSSVGHGIEYYLFNPEEKEARKAAKLGENGIPPSSEIFTIQRV